MMEAKSSEAAPLPAFPGEVVCTLDDLVPGGGVCARVAGQQVAIFYLPGEAPPLYALGNFDPIGRANVLSRGILCKIGDELAVASPLYKQHFSLRTGRCLEDPQVAVPVWRVSLVGECVVVAP
ncbi:MAG: nitrite reductase small subunit [Porticoccaceae bacterium]|nr:MAG: nitrite reductase small subunit [Porticoccaceae bacterium]